MAIQQLDIRGFRSFREATWRPGKLNLLVGENGSGKSNLLLLLELIAGSARKELARSIARQGGIVPLLWDQTAGSLGWKLRMDAPLPRPSGRSEAHVFECEITQSPRSSSYSISRESLGTRTRSGKRGELSRPRIYSRDREGGHLHKRKNGRAIPYSEIDSDETFLSQMSGLAVEPAVAHAKRYLERWSVIQEVRAGRGSAMRMPVTTQYVKQLDPDGSNLATVLFTLYGENREFRQQIDEGMCAGFFGQYEELVFLPAAAQQIQLGVRWQSSHQPHVGQDLSDGTLRYLFLLTVLASPEPPTLIAIDEPETGLHPSMLPVLAEYAVDAADRTQVIMTSHSPGFLDAFSKVSPQVTLCQWKDGQSQLLDLETASLDTWLQKYPLGQLFTSGELEILARPDVDSSPELVERLRKLPSVETLLDNMA